MQVLRSRIRARGGLLVRALFAKPVAAGIRSYWRKTTTHPRPYRKEEFMQTHSVGASMILARKLLLALISAIGVGACAPIPVAELTQYRDAFNQAKNVSEQVLLDYDQALKAAETFVAKPEAAEQRTGPYPTDWKGVARDRTGSTRDDIETRRKALLVIERYNDVLSNLAEGKSIEQVKSSSAGLVKSLSNFREALGGAAIPGLSAITGLVSILFEQLEKARLREEFVRAVQAGSPVVEKILDAFVADTEDHYKARAVLANRDRLRVMVRMRNAQRSVARVLNSYNVTEKELAPIRAKVDATFSVQKGELAASLIAMSGGGSAAPAFAEVARAQVQDELAELAQLAATYSENVQQVRALTAMLDQYRALLLKTKSLLGVLVVALDKPQDVAAATDELLNLAFNVRRNLEELKAARP